MKPPLAAATLRDRWIALAERLLLLALLWAVLVEGHPKGLWVGLIAVPLALGASLALAPLTAERVRLVALARFLPVFFWRSLVGSLDVARRALHPRMPLAPGLVEVSVQLPSPPARLFFSSVVSLMPGTLGVAMEEERLTLHLLDTGEEALPGTLQELRALEGRVAPIFGHAPMLEGPR